jgi:hypothetical protein
MISAVRIAGTRAARRTVVPRAVGVTRSFAIGDALASKVSRMMLYEVLMRSTD